MTASNRPPLLIASAPNGAYKTRRDHRALPLTASQLAETAAAVMRAGARMLHLHVRDEHGKHTLAAAAYQAAIKAIRARVGDDLFIQITSESAGAYTAKQQRQAIDATLAAGIGADGISIAPRELIRAPEDVMPAGDLLQRIRQAGVLVQYILYSNDDIARYHALLKQNIIPPNGHAILLVIGKQKEPNSLHQMTTTLPTPINWMLCAFGPQEFNHLTQATNLGGHVRVGFENSLHLLTGEVAADNCQLITQLVESGNPTNRPLADARQARGILDSSFSNDRKTTNYPSFSNGRK